MKTAEHEPENEANPSQVCFHICWHRLSLWDLCLYFGASISGVSASIYGVCASISGVSASISGVSASVEHEPEAAANPSHVH
eukprot:3484432-Rhodomonas_salina.1